MFTFKPCRVDYPLPPVFHPVDLQTVICEENGRMFQRVVGSPQEKDPNEGLLFQDFSLDTLGFTHRSSLSGKSPIPAVSLDNLRVADAIMSIPRAAFDALLASHDTSVASAPAAAPDAAPAAPAASAPAAAPAAFAAQ